MTMRTIWVKFKTVTSMKKIFTKAMLVAAAAMAFFACQKQEINAPEEVTNVTLSFSSEKPSFDDEAKTQWNGSSIVWSAGDKISVAYTVEGEWMGYMPEENTTASAPKLYKSDPLEASSPTAKFNVPGNFNIKAEGTHVFYGVYPAISSTSFDDAPVATVTIPSIQNPEASSFDSSADLMTGVSVGEFNSLPRPEDEISMMWTRLVAHANITLKSVNGIATDEKIFSITLTAQDDANLVGKQKVNLLKNDEVNKAVASAKTNQVQINGGNLSVVNGNVEFWACILPATLTSLKVEVDTDKATYTREITGISKTFKQNARNTLSIKMYGATRVEKAVETWKLVTPAEGITEGTYAFVAKTSTKTGVLVSSNGASSAPTYYTSGISIENDCLVGVSDAMQFDIAGTAGNYVIYVAGGTSKWLYCNSKNDGIRVGTGSDKTWTIVAHPKNSSVFEIKNNGKSRYLGVYNNQDWRSYESSDATNFTNDAGSSQIYLYKKTSGSVAPDTTPTLEVGKTEIELTSNGGEGTLEVTAVNVSSLQVRALAQADSEDEVAWLSVEYDENGTLSYAAEANGSENSREAYIEIYAEDLEGNPLNEYIHVTQAGKSEGGVAEPVDVTISFATTAQRTSQTTSQQVWTNGGVVLTNNKSESQNDVVDSSNPVRFYAASQIIITAPGNISQIVFDCNTNEYATNLKNSISGASVDVSNDKVTITLNGSSDTFTIAKLSAQVRADAVTVTCLGEATGGETPEPDEPETPVEPEQLTMSDITCFAQTENSLTFTWKAVANATGYEVSCNNKTETVTTTQYVATNLAASTSYTISVVAKGNGADYLDSQPKTQTGTTKETQSSVTLSVDFENTSYAEWTVSNLQLKQSGDITPKGGSYYGTTGGKTTASITTKDVYASPNSITCYVSKTSSNTNADSKWNIQVSSNGSTWTTVKTQSASSMTKGNWVELTADLSSYSNVYVRVAYSGTSAVRAIDNLIFTYTN